MKKRSMSEAEILIGLDMFLSETEIPVIDFLLDLKELKYEYISMDDNGMIKAFKSYPYKSSGTGKWSDMQGGESLHIARIGRVFDDGNIYNRVRDSQTFTISDLILDQVIMDEVKSGSKKCKNCDSVKNLINSWEHTSEPDIIEMGNHYDELYISGYDILDGFDEDFDNEDFAEEDIFESLYREISESDYEEENYSEAEEFLESLEDNIRYILTQYTGIDDDDIIIEKSFMDDDMDILNDSDKFESTNETNNEEEIIVEKVFDVYRDDNMRLLSDGTLFIDGKKVHGAEVGNSDDDYEEEEYPDFYNKSILISTMLPAKSKGTERIDSIFRKLPQIVQDYDYLFDEYDLIYMAVNKDGRLSISEMPFVYNESLGTYLADKKARFYFKKSIGIPPHNHNGKCVFFESKVYI